MRRPLTKGFTLVELLVVIGIIALLISVLMPTLGKTRAAAQSVACKSLLRQYALASQMYMNDNDGCMVDIFKYMDYDAGLPKYFNVPFMTEKLTRCPGDQEASLGEIGKYTDPTFTTLDYRLTRKDGSYYSVRTSIGANISPMSASNFVRRTSATPTLTPRWLKPSKLQIVKSAGQGWDPSRVMTWGDWQNNPKSDAPEVPVIQPLVEDNIGTLAFRHNGVANAAFLDGHVGQIKPTLRLRKGGLQLDSGETWTPPGVTIPGTLMRHYQLYYPFGPGFEGKNIRMRGDFPTISIQ